LTSPPSPFDVEQFRTEPRRVALARAVTRPTLVLGSTQPAELVDGNALRRRDMDLARRRGGGGAVYLEPGAQLWLDAWIPRDDPMWRVDVSAAAEWIGRWWIEALAGLGLGRDDFDVHTGRASPGRLGELVCFGGRGPGEVFYGERKLVGLSQWRAREGALFSSCAYLRWEPAALLELMLLDPPLHQAMTRDLMAVAVGLGELDPALADLGPLRDRLLGSFHAFGAGGGARGE
jgi:lipoate-protein ligase A